MNRFKAEETEFINKFKDLIWIQVSFLNKKYEALMLVLFRNHHRLR